MREPLILVVNQETAVGGAEEVLLSYLTHDKSSRFLLLTPGGELAARAKAVGIRIDSDAPLPLRTASGPFRRLRLIVFNCSAVVRAAVRSRSDVLYANNLRAGLYCLVAAILLRKPLIWHIHDIVGRWTGLCLALVARLRRNMAIVVVSKAVQTTVPNSMVLYNAIEPGLLLPRPEADGPVRILGYGRIIRWKGYDVLINALSQLEDRDSWTCDIMGVQYDVAYVEELRSLIEERGLRDNVRFAEPLPRSAVLRTLRTTDIVVHTAVQPDPFPTTVLESMAAGCCVVASDNGGVPEMITHGETGYLYSPGDARSLSEVLGVLVKDVPHVRAVGAAAASSAKRFSHERKAEGFEAVVRQIWEAPRW